MKPFAAVIIGAALLLPGAAQAQNTTTLPKTATAATGGNSWSEHFIPIRKGDTLSTILRALGVSPEEIAAIAAVLGSAGDGNLREGQRLRVLLSPIVATQRSRPVRVILMDGETVEAEVAKKIRRWYLTPVVRFTAGASLRIGAG